MNDAHYLKPLPLTFLAKWSEWLFRMVSNVILRHHGQEESSSVYLMVCLHSLRADIY
jgi:hypothetical protein